MNGGHHTLSEEEILCQPRLVFWRRQDTAPRPSGTHVYAPGRRKPGLLEARDRRPYSLDRCASWGAVLRRVKRDLADEALLRHGRVDDACQARNSRPQTGSYISFSACAARARWTLVGHWGRYSPRTFEAAVETSSAAASVIAAIDVSLVLSGSGLLR